MQTVAMNNNRNQEQGHGQEQEQGQEQDTGAGVRSTFFTACAFSFLLLYSAPAPVSSCSVFIGRFSSP